MSVDVFTTMWKKADEIEYIMGNRKNASNQHFFCIPKPFPKRQILDPSNLKEFAEDNFKFDENG